VPSLPRITERAQTHYAAIAQDVRIPFGDVIGSLMDEAAGYLGGVGAAGFGPAIFRYEVIDMPRLAMQFGFVTPAAVPGNARVKPDVLPAGKYVTLTYFGHYDNLQTVTGDVITWAREQGIEWDSTPGPNGERFAARFELYPNGPMDEPDPAKWETQIWIKAKD
jgi:hypothetical protein